MYIFNNVKLNFEGFFKNIFLKKITYLFYITLSAKPQPIRDRPKIIFKAGQN